MIPSFFPAFSLSFFPYFLLPLFLSFLLSPTSGEDEEQEQAGSPAAGHHQGVGDAGGGEDQGRGAGVAPHHRQEMGRLAEELHPGTASVSHTAPHMIHTQEQHAAAPYRSPNGPCLTSAPTAVVLQHESRIDWALKGAIRGLL